MNTFFFLRHLGVTGVLLLGATHAHAITLTVTSLKDAGFGSLREAILRANSAPDADTIVFGPRLRGTLGLQSSLPDLTSSVSIIGPGRERLNVRRTGTARYRIFNITKEGSVLLSGLTLSNGFAQSLNKNDEKSGAGGGVHNEGVLQMKDCALIGNQSTGNGGAIFNTGPKVMLTNCVVTDNNCLLTKPPHDPTYGGGGLFNKRDDVAMVITDCTFSRNACRNDGDGGAIKNASHATVRIRRTTLTQNTAPRSGGALDAVANIEYGGGFDISESLIANNTALDAGAIEAAQYGDTIILTNCTVSGNKATRETEGVGAIRAGTGGVKLQNCTIVNNIGSKCGGVQSSVYSSISGCIIAGNLLPSHAPGIDITLLGRKEATQSSPSRGSNLIGRSDDATLAYFHQPGDRNNVSLAGLKLGPLTDNGGPTKTHALLPGSPAIDTGASYPASNNTDTDQRGVLHSQGKEGHGDIGAFQTIQTPTPKIKK